MFKSNAKNPELQLAKLLLELTRLSYKKISEMIKKIIPNSIIGPRYLATIALRMRKEGIPVAYRRRGPTGSTA